MIATSMATVLAGGGIVAAASYVPSRVALLERAGGLLLCVGLMMVGMGLGR